MLVAWKVTKFIVKTLKIPPFALVCPFQFPRLMNVRKYRKDAELHGLKNERQH